MGRRRGGVQRGLLGGAEEGRGTAGVVRWGGGGEGYSVGVLGGVFCVFDGSSCGVDVRLVGNSYA